MMAYCSQQVCKSIESDFETTFLFLWTAFLGFLKWISHILPEVFLRYYEIYFFETVVGWLFTPVGWSWLIALNSGVNQSTPLLDRGIHITQNSVESLEWFKTRAGKSKSLICWKRLKGGKGQIWYAVILLAKKVPH